MIQRIFRRVQFSRAEGIVLDAILSKSNMFGKHARVAYECLAGMTGYSIRHVKRIVKSLILERRLLRVTKRVLWRGHNAINVYDVVVPWRREVTYEDMEIGKKYPRQDRVNNKGDMRCHPKGQNDINPLLQPAQTFTKMPTEKDASNWFRDGSDLWYFAQGKTPPGTGTE
jgi:hypothetical protein